MSETRTTSPYIQKGLSKPAPNPLRGDVGGEGGRGRSAGGAVP